MPNQSHAISKLTRDLKSVTESVSQIHATNTITNIFFPSLHSYRFKDFDVQQWTQQQQKLYPSIDFNENVKICYRCVFAYSFSDFHLRFIVHIVFTDVVLVASFAWPSSYAVIKLCRFSVYVYYHLIELIITISNNGQVIRGIHKYFDTSTYSILTHTEREIQNKNNTKRFCVCKRNPCVFIGSFTLWRINDLFVNLNKKKFCCFSDVLNWFCHINDNDDIERWREKERKKTGTALKP